MQTLIELGVTEKAKALLERLAADSHRMYDTFQYSLVLRKGWPATAVLVLDGAPGFLPLRFKFRRHRIRLDFLDTSEIEEVLGGDGTEFDDIINPLSLDDYFEQNPQKKELLDMAYEEAVNG